MHDVTGFITAGGRSSRMGIDKAWLEIGGQPIIERIIQALRTVTPTIGIIANTDAYFNLDLPVFADSVQGVGPLEAIRTALSNTSTDRVLLVGCDLPFVTPELFTFLLSVASHRDTVVPLDAYNRLEPLCAIYCKDSLNIVSDLIESGERKVARLFDLVPTYFVAFDQIRRLEGSHLFFENINTPEDYQRALQAALRLSRSPG